MCRFGANNGPAVGACPTSAVALPLALAAIDDPTRLYACRSSVSRGNAEVTKRRRRFQYTIRFALLVTLLSAFALGILVPSPVQLRTTLVGLRSFPDVDNGSPVPCAVVRIENVGRGRVWISGRSFVAFRGFNEPDTSVCTYQTRPLHMICLRPGASAELTIPVRSTSTGEAIWVGQKVAKRRSAVPEVYWSGKLELDAELPSTARMQRGAPPE